MSWTLGAVTIHPDDKGYAREKSSNYAIQAVLDATSETVSYYGANSRRVNLNFVVFGDENGGTGVDTLEGYVDANTDQALAGDQGAVGNYRILQLRSVRRQALNHTGETFECAASLIKV